MHVFCKPVRNIIFSVTTFKSIIQKSGSSQKCLLLLVQFIVVSDILVLKQDTKNNDTMIVKDIRKWQEFIDDSIVQIRKFKYISTQIIRINSKSITFVLCMKIIMYFYFIISIQFNYSLEIIIKNCPFTVVVAATTKTDYLGLNILQGDPTSPF